MVVWIIGEVDLIGKLIFIIGCSLGFGKFFVFYFVCLGVIVIVFMCNLEGGKCFEVEEFIDIVIKENFKFLIVELDVIDFE